MTKKIYPFASAPDEFIMMHKVLFVHVFPPLSGSATKVLLHIIFKTKGWQKTADDISYSQIRTDAGISSDETVRRSIMELRGFLPAKEGRKIIGWRRVPEMPQLIIAYANKSEGGMDATTTYRLNENFEIEIEKPRSTFSVERSTFSVDTIDKPNSKRESSITISSLSNSKGEADFDFPQSFGDLDEFERLEP